MTTLSWFFKEGGKEGKEEGGEGGRKEGRKIKTGRRREKNINNTTLSQDDQIKPKQNKKQNKTLNRWLSELTSRRMNVQGNGQKEVLAIDIV